MGNQLNPLRYAHQKLWQTLESHPGFCALVPPPKRLQTTLFYLPQLNMPVTEADTPRVLITLGDVQFSLAASNTLFITAEYEIVIQVAGLDYDLLADVLWTIQEALGSTLMQWAQDQYIDAIHLPKTECKITPLHDRMFQVAGGKAIVEMHYPLTALQKD